MLVTWMSRLSRASVISRWRPAFSKFEVFRFVFNLRFPLGDLDKHWNINFCASGLLLIIRGIWSIVTVSRIGPADSAITNLSSLECPGEQAIWGSVFLFDPGEFLVGWNCKGCCRCIQWLFHWLCIGRLLLLFSFPIAL